MKMSPIRIIQVSDIHLFQEPEEELLSVKTQESFKTIIDLIKAEGKPIDIILLSGDLSQDGSEKSYKCIADMVECLGAPVYWIPGNHDNVPVMSTVYPYKSVKNDKHIVLPNWQLILLNSQLPNAVEGELDSVQLKFLSDCLQSNTNDPAIIFMHHQPVSVQTTWLEPLGLNNPEDLWQVLQQFSQVHSIFFAHVHQEFAGDFHGIPCYALPSTCIQFKPNVVDFALDNVPPGYRWIELYEDGHLETGIVRAKNYVGTFDKDAKGY